jgi:hypothetical protein
MVVKIGPREVIVSGSVVVDGDNTVSISVRDLTISIQFLDEEEGSPSVRAETVGDKGLKFLLSGFENVLGTAYDTAIGIIDGKPLVMGLWVEALSKGKKKEEDKKRSIRLLSYTFSVGEGFVE